MPYDAVRSGRAAPAPAIEAFRRKIPLRLPLLAGNWKMNKTIGDALAFAGAFIPEMLNVMGEKAGQGPGSLVWPELLICPPFTAIPALAAVLSGYPVGVGAQDGFWQEKGAFTGEVSTAMLKDAGCSYVIVGHSERRHVMGETDEMARKKVRAVLGSGMKPILCVGETIEQREKGDTYRVCETMTREGLGEVRGDEIPRAVIAYEPVWAIGTGKEARPEDARDAIRHIRATVDSMFGSGASEGMRVLYGGSVKSANIRAFMGYPEIDGALVGGASLDPIEFAKLVLEVRKGRPEA
jgi:triosephosphate isomerase